MDEHVGDCAFLEISGPESVTEGCDACDVRIGRFEDGDDLAGVRFEHVDLVGHAITHPEVAAVVGEVAGVAARDFVGPEDGAVVGDDAVDALLGEDEEDIIVPGKTGGGAFGGVEDDLGDVGGGVVGVDLAGVVITDPEEVLAEREAGGIEGGRIVGVDDGAIGVGDVVDLGVTPVCDVEVFIVGGDPGRVITGGSETSINITGSDGVQWRAGDHDG